jgi:DNA-binding FadR family transcriptional regulator
MDAFVRNMKSSIDIAASQLRSTALSSKEGALLGNEDSLIKSLGVSRSTIRQVARLLEREGLLRVKRGSSGGYFAGRPDVHTVETAVSAYLEHVHTSLEDVTSTAAVLWIQVIRRAAMLKSKRSIQLSHEYLRKVTELDGGASFMEVSLLETEHRKALFTLTSSFYTALIFDISVAFARRNYPAAVAEDAPGHREFVKQWRNTKVLELESIANGDPELATIAAQYARKVWHRRLSPRAVTR